MDGKLEKAVEIAQNGDKLESQLLVASYLKENPANPNAWALLSDLVEAPERKLNYAERALDLAPNEPKYRNLVTNARSLVKERLEIGSAVDETMAEAEVSENMVAEGVGINKQNGSMNGAFPIIEEEATQHEIEIPEETKIDEDAPPLETPFKVVEEEKTEAELEIPNIYEDTIVSESAIDDPTLTYADEPLLGSKGSEGSESADLFPPTVLSEDTITAEAEKVASSNNLPARLPPQEVTPFVAAGAAVDPIPSPMPQPQMAAAAKLAPVGWGHRILQLLLTIAGIVVFTILAWRLIELFTLLFPDINWPKY